MSDPTTESLAADKRTITLSFSEGDMTLLQQITKDALADERAVSKYLLRYLKQNYETSAKDV